MLSNRDLAQLNSYNYFINGGGESGTTGLQTFNTTFSGGLPGAITLGSSLVSLASTTSHVLAGSESDQFICSTATGSAGHGWITTPMTLTDADLAKIMALSFDYNFVSGNSNVSLTGLDASQTIQVWIYNVGKAQWIQPAGYNSIGVNGTSSQLVPGRTPPITFQTDISNTSNNNQYQIAWIIRNAPSGVFTMNIDCIYFGRQKQAPSGAPVTDWVSYTPSFTGFGTVTAINAWWRRVGDSIEISGTFTTGTPDSSIAQITLPNGWTADTIKVPSLLAVGQFEDGATTAVEVAIALIVGGRNYISFGTYLAGQMALTERQGAGFTAPSTGESFYALIPIEGFSSNTIMSADTDTRVVTMCAIDSTGAAPTGPINTVFSGNTIIAASTSDTHGGYDPTTGNYTVSVPGFYDFGVNIIMNVTATAGQYTGLGLFQNGTQIADDSSDPGAGSIIAQNRIVIKGVWAKAGDVFAIQSRANTSVATFASLSGNNYFSLCRQSGPATIAATETVVASYYATSAESLAVNQNINYDTKDIDTHGAVTTGSGWVFTAPVSGLYTILVNVLFTDASHGVLLFINGVSSNYIAGSAGANFLGSGGRTVRLIAGQTVFVAPDGISTTGAGGAGIYFNSISIARIGN